MKRHGWLLWMVIPLLLGGLIWWLTRPPVESAQPDTGVAGPPSGGPVPTRNQLAGLQAKADAACLCGRARGRPWDDQCWADYRRSVARFNPSSEVTACGEESVSIDCFDLEGSNQQCVIRARGFGACSSAEFTARAEAARRTSSRGCSD